MFSGSRNLDVFRRFMVCQQPLQPRPPAPGPSLALWSVFFPYTAVVTCLLSDYPFVGVTPLFSPRRRFWNSILNCLDASSWRQRPLKVHFNSKTLSRSLSRLGRATRSRSSRRRRPSRKSSSKGWIAWRPWRTVAATWPSMARTRTDERLPRPRGVCTVQAWLRKLFKLCSLSWIKRA